MAFAVRCLFFLFALGGLAFFLYTYRRRTNAILAIVVFSYTVMAGARLLTVENEAEILGPGLIALGGLGLLWVAVWLGARWAEKRGWPGGD